MNESDLEMHNTSADGMRSWAHIGSSNVLYRTRYLARTWRAVALIGALPMDSNCPMMHGDGSRFFVCVVAFKCAYVRRTAAGMIVGLFFLGGEGGFEGCSAP